MRLNNKDRSVSLNSHLFEAPVGLIGKKIELVFNETEPLKVEAIFAGNSLGNLPLLDPQINSKVYRSGYEAKSKSNPKETSENTIISQGGTLFELGEAKND